MVGTTEKKSSRLVEIDLIKAFGIIFMVAVHACIPGMNNLLLFHMAIFFIASGFFYKSSSSDTAKSTFGYIVRKIKQLWVPYFIWNAIFTLCNNLFLRIHVYTDNPKLAEYVAGEYIGAKTYMGLAEMVKNILKGFVFMGGTQIGGAFWFFKVLFGVSVGYCVVDFIVKKILPKHSIWLQAVISILLLGAGYYCSVKRISLHGLEQVSTCYWMYFVGYLFGMFKEKYMDAKWWLYVIAMAVSLGVLVKLSGGVIISIGKNSYGNPGILIAASLAGWVLMFGIAHFIKQIPVITPALTLIGQRTMPIMLLHFLCMKPVAYIVTVYYKIPTFCVAAFPNLYGHIKAWWLPYTIAGVLIPLILDGMYRKTKKFLPNITK